MLIRQQGRHFGTLYVGAEISSHSCAGPPASPALRLRTRRNGTKGRLNRGAGFNLRCFLLQSTQVGFAANFNANGSSDRGWKPQHLLTMQHIRNDNFICCWARWALKRKDGMGYAGSVQGGWSENPACAPRTTGTTQTAC